MRKCPFCDEEIQDAAIKCRHCQSDLDNVNADLCPKCASSIKSEARVCPSCQFAIWEHKQNKHNAKKTEMHLCVGDERAYLLQSFKEQRGSFGLKMLALWAVGILFMFIPYVGWLIGLVFIMAGNIIFIAPVRGSALLMRLANPDEYKSRKELAAGRARNTYDHAECPFCRTVFASSSSGRNIFWSDESGTIDCRVCKNNILRYREILLYIPYPDVYVGTSPEEYIAEAKLVSERYALAG